MDDCTDKTLHFERLAITINIRLSFVTKGKPGSAVSKNGVCILKVRGSFVELRGIPAVTAGK
jgi:hypothetical protein